MNTTTYNKSLSINGIVAHYKEQGHNDTIKLFYRKSEVRSHKSEDGRAFHTVRPCVVIVGSWIDDHINFTMTLKNKYVYIMESKDCDLWCMEIDKQTKTFKPSDDVEYEYHNVSLRFIASPKLKARVESLYQSSNGICEANDDYI